MIIHSMIIVEGKNEYLYCFFCYKQLNEFVKTGNEICCEHKNVVDESGTLVYDNCGQVDGYQIGKEHFDFYENMYKVKK